jgi:hypothetical protein
VRKIYSSSLPRREEWLKGIVGSIIDGLSSEKWCSAVNPDAHGFGQED